MNLIESNHKAISDICSSYEVEQLYAFGSALTDRFNNQSDIDFIVSIQANDPIEYAENYFNLKFELERVLNRSIDLLEHKALKNQTLKQIINKTKKLIYERRDSGLA